MSKSGKTTYFILLFVLNIYVKNRRKTRKKNFIPIPNKLNIVCFLKYSNIFTIIPKFKTFPIFPMIPFWNIYQKVNFFVLFPQNDVITLIISYTRNIAKKSFIFHNFAHLISVSHAIYLLLMWDFIVLSLLYNLWKVLKVKFIKNEHLNNIKGGRNVFWIFQTSWHWNLSRTFPPPYI